MVWGLFFDTEKKMQDINFFLKLETLNFKWVSCLADMNWNIFEICLSRITSTITTLIATLSLLNNCQKLLTGTIFLPQCLCYKLFQAKLFLWLKIKNNKIFVSKLLKHGYLSSKYFHLLLFIILNLHNICFCSLKFSCGSHYGIYVFCHICLL